MTEWPTSSPDTQIRDKSYPVASESLQTAGYEAVADEAFRDLLRQEWLDTQAAPTPNVYASDEKFQQDLRRGDVLVVYVENYQEIPNGHRHEFVDLEITLGIHVRTVHSKQRMWNIVAELRRITYRWMLAFKPWHALYFDGFQPEPVGPNNFSGIARIRLTAGAVPWSKRRVDGEPNPNTDPGAFPQGS